jgi:hypothetical protein
MAVGTSLQGDAGGNAWNVSASIMDFRPDHSVGILYGRTESGWLLSPQFANNEKQLELRYSWQPKSNLIVEARIRRREDIDQLASAARKQEDLNFFLRLTWQYSSVGKSPGPLKATNRSSYR